MTNSAYAHQQTATLEHPSDPRLNLLVYSGVIRPGHQLDAGSLVRETMRLLDENPDDLTMLHTCPLVTLTDGEHLHVATVEVDLLDPETSDAFACTHLPQMARHVGATAAALAVPVKHNITGLPMLYLLVATRSQVGVFVGSLSDASMEGVWQWVEEDPSGEDLATVQALRQALTA